MKLVGKRAVVKGLAALMVVVTAFPIYAADRRHSDVENIGNRSITGKVWAIFPNFVSLEKEIALGAQVAAQFEQTARLVEDPVIAEYIDRVGQNIVKHSDAKVPFHIKVVDTDEVNAFAFPGGYFYVNKGLILAAENEAELAGVMAHEISHVAAQTRHGTYVEGADSSDRCDPGPFHRRILDAGRDAERARTGHQSGVAWYYARIGKRGRSARHSVPLEFGLRSQCIHLVLRETSRAGEEQARQDGRLF